MSSRHTLRGQGILMCPHHRDAASITRRLCRHAYRVPGLAGRKLLGCSSKVEQQAYILRAGGSNPLTLTMKHWCSG